MTVKESFDLAGAPTTWGMPALKDNVARTDSVVVEGLRSAGAVVFGKTNVPFALGDLQSYNEIYGSTGNPWDPSRTHHQQMFWAGLTGVAFLPSTVIPTGPDANGLPIGVQLVGPAYGDRVTIGAAAALEATGFAFRPPPGLS